MEFMSFANLTVRNKYTFYMMYELSISIVLQLCSQSSGQLDQHHPFLKFNNTFQF